jgi:hypothetical protein
LVLERCAINLRHSSLRETNGTALAAYLRLDYLATHAKVYDADLELGALELYIPILHGRMTRFPFVRLVK